ncbi:MAG: TlyA family RNA methyltransferase, partial [Oscillospiraceae bacterium]|nr:TlyA family RNA methyltransferase [Oscillospiraceae bacterium]
GAGLRYVSRGGQKLERAIEAFGIGLDGSVCVDIGASTGGFTDCMLQHGAARVYAIDVGYGQIAWKLREDTRVVVMERTNIRGVTPRQIPETPDFISIDVSFISLALVLPVAAALLKSGGHAVCLLKPQFEAGREKVGKKGVVRDPEVHLEVLRRVCGIAADNGFAVLGAEFSPVRGPQGNIEYLIYIEKSDANTAVTDDGLKSLVSRSHLEL